MATEQNSPTRARNTAKRCCVAWQRAYDAFMACLSHGIRTGTVPLDQSGPLSYAAKVALSTVQYSAK